MSTSLLKVNDVYRKLFPLLKLLTLHGLLRTFILYRRSTVVCFVFIEYNLKFFSRESLQNFLELLNLANCGWNAATSCWRIKSTSVRTSSKQKAVTVVGERKTKRRNAPGRESINSLKGRMLPKLSRPLLSVLCCQLEEAVLCFFCPLDISYFNVCSGFPPFVMSQT